MLASYKSPFDAYIGSPGNTINHLSHGNSPRYAKPTGPGRANHHPAERDKARWPILSKAVDVHSTQRPHTGTEKGRPRTRATNLAQTAVHFAQIRPFSVIFSEVDCVLGQKTGDNTAPTTKPGHAHATRPRPRQTELIQATSTVTRGTIPLCVSPSASSARSSSYRIWRFIQNPGVVPK